MFLVLCNEKKCKFVCNMDRLKFIEKIPPLFRNKFFLATAVFVVCLIIIDSNNLISRCKELNQLYKLRKEKEFYSEKIKTDKEKLYELKTNNQNLEKFAREQYRMKKPDEDLYILMTPAEDRKNTRRNN